MWREGGGEGRGVVLEGGRVRGGDVEGGKAGERGYLWREGVGERGVCGGRKGRGICGERDFMEGWEPYIEEGVGRWVGRAGEGWD